MFDFNIYLKGVNKELTTHLSYIAQSRAIFRIIYIIRPGNIWILSNLEVFKIRWLGSLERQFLIH